MHPPSANDRPLLSNAGGDFKRRSERRDEDINSAVLPPRELTKEAPLLLSSV